MLPIRCFVYCVSTLFVRNATEVKHNLVAVLGQFLEDAVGGEEDNDVGFVVGFAIRGELEDVVALYVGFYYEDLRIVAALHHFRGDVLGGAFAKVVDVGLEGEAHHGYPGFAVVLEFELKHALLNALGTPEGLVVVRLAGGGNHTALAGEVGGDEVGIDSDAVTTYAAARPEDIDTRVLVGQADEFPHVDTCLFADDREFVGESYLYVSAGVLGEFAHLGRLAVGAVERTQYKLAVELDSGVGRSFVHTANNAVVVNKLIDDVARQHALGAVSNVDLSFEFGTQLEDECGHLVGSAYGRSTLNDVKVTIFEEGHNGTRGGFHIRDVGLVIALEGRGDDHEIGVAHFGGGGGVECTALYHFLQHLFHAGFDDVEVSLICHLYYFGVDVNARNLYAVLGGDDSCGQADVAKPHKTCFHWLI